MLIGVILLVCLIVVSVLLDFCRETFVSGPAPEDVAGPGPSPVVADTPAPGPARGASKVFLPPSVLVRELSDDVQAAVANIQKAFKANCDNYASLKNSFQGATIDKALNVIMNDAEYKKHHQHIVTSLRYCQHQ